MLERKKPSRMGSDKIGNALMRIDARAIYAQTQQLGFAPPILPQFSRNATMVYLYGLMLKNDSEFMGTGRNDNAVRIAIMSYDDIYCFSICPLSAILVDICPKGKVKKVRKWLDFNRSWIDHLSGNKGRAIYSHAGL